MSARCNLLLNLEVVSSPRCWFVVILASVLETTLLLLQTSELWTVSEIHSFKFYLHLFILCVGGTCYVPAMAHTEVKGQLMEASFLLLPHGSWGSNSDPQV